MPGLIGQAFADEIFRVFANRHPEIVLHWSLKGRRMLLDMPVPHGPKRRILIVDDNTDAAATLVVLLRRLGHEVETAHDGAMAIAVAPRMQPNVIFLDIALPGMDGFQVAEALRMDPSFNRLFIVAVTGMASEEDRIRADEVGIDLYLIKPFDIRFIESLVGDATTKP
jgi:CheY-like chemotaxis protein